MTGNFGEVILHSLRAVSRYARKTPFEKTYWGDAVLTEESSISLSKQRRPLKSSPSTAALTLLLEMLINPSHDKIALPDEVVFVFVKRIALFNFPFQAMHGEVHFSQFGIGLRVEANDTS